MQTRSNRTRGALRSTRFKTLSRTSPSATAFSMCSVQYGGLQSRRRTTNRRGHAGHTTATVKNSASSAFTARSTWMRLMWTRYGSDMDLNGIVPEPSPPLTAQRRHMVPVRISTRRHQRRGAHTSLTVRDTALRHPPVQDVGAAQAPDRHVFLEPSSAYLPACRAPSPLVTLMQATRENILKNYGDAR